MSLSLKRQYRLTIILILLVAALEVVSYLFDFKYAPLSAVLVLILITLIITLYPLNQLRGMGNIIKGIANGERDRHDLPIHLDNEIGDLYRSFNALLDKVENKEKELCLAKEQLELAISGTSDGLWDWDVVNNTFDVSKRYLGMLGYEYGDFVVNYKSLESLIHPDDVSRLKEFTKLYFHGKEDKYEIEFRMKHKDGYYVDLLSRGSAVRDDDRNVVRLIGINTDITERKRQITKLIIFEEMQKQTLIREVHHRIKNNLQGVASLLRQNQYAAYQYKGELDKAISQVYTMAMVHGIQGKQSNGNIYIEEMLKEIVNITSDITGVEIKLAGINAHCRYRVVENEAVPVALILNELITNACKYSKNKNIVNVEIECNWCQKEEIRITILNDTDSFTTDINLERKTGLGTGLNLVVSLLPPEGSKLNIGEKEGICRTEIKLGVPVIFVESDWEFLKLRQA